MAVLIPLSGAGAAGPAGPPGSSGSSGLPTAPNIPSATAVAAYAMPWNDSVFGFSGVITLPAALTHLKWLSVQARVTGTAKWTEIAIFDTPTGATLPYLGGEFNMTQATQGWDVRFVCADEAGIPTPSPFTVAGVFVAASLVTGATGSDSGVLSIDPLTRMGSTDLTISPVLSGNIVPQNVTFWVPSYSDPTKFTYIGWKKMTAVGQVFTITRLCPVAAYSGKVACCAGAISSDSRSDVAQSALPAGTFISASFTVAAIAPPSTALVSATITIPPGVAGSWPYNQIREDGSQYWSIPSVSFDDTPAISDPSMFAIRWTAEDLDVNGVSVRGEEAWSGEQVSIAGEIKVYGPLMGEYGTAPNRTGNICSVRLKLYSYSRVQQTGAAWLNPLASTLQKTVVVLVAAGGLIPPGQQSPTRWKAGSTGRKTWINALGQLDTNLDGSGNVLADPGFEENPTRWGGQGDIAVGLGASGNSCYRCPATQWYGVSQLVQVKPSSKWVISAAVTNDTGFTGTVAIAVNYYSDTAGTALIQAVGATAIVMNPAIWQPITGTYTAPDTCKSMLVGIVQQSATVAAKYFYVDNMSMRPQTPTGAGTQIDPTGAVAVKVSSTLPVGVDASGFLTVKTSTGLGTDAGGNIQIPTGAVTNALLGALSVATAQLQDNSVANTKIASVDCGKLYAGVAKIGTALIANAAITNALIGNLAVGTANIADASITNAKIGNLAVGTAQIQDAAITAAKIGTLTVAQITGWGGATISVGSGLTITGSGSTVGLSDSVNGAAVYTTGVISSGGFSVIGGGPGLTNGVTQTVTIGSVVLTIRGGIIVKVVFTG